MHLPSNLRKILFDALVDAFPDSDQLEVVAFTIGKDAEQAMPDRNMETKIIALIKWAEANDQIEQLLAAATGVNPDNKQLSSAGNELAPQFRESHQPIS